MGRLIKLAGDDCNNGVTCPAVYDLEEPDYVYVIGDKTDADEVGLAERIAGHEGVIRIPRSMWENRQ